MRKLKVVEFTPKLGFGGTEKTLYTFCKYLDREKFDVAACALGSDPHSGREQAIRGLGVDTAILPLDGLEAHLKKLNADIFHIHRGGWAEPGPITAAKRAGVPVVVEHNVFGRMDNSEENELIDCHIFISHACAWRYQLWAGEALVAPKYQTLYYPVEVAAFDAFGFENRDFSKKAIGRIGRADNTKWDFSFLEAIPPLVNTFPDLEFHVIGMTPKARNWLIARGVEKNVEEHPVTGDERAIMNFYANISALTHFAEMGETFGLTLAEAMAARLPVVTHHTPPLKDGAQAELVNHGYNGFVAYDAQMYTQAVTALLSDPEGARQMGRRGYDKARLSYDATLITTGLEKIITNLAGWKGIV